MKRVDSHQHFWQYEPVKDAWITEEMQLIRRNFMPNDLEPILIQNQVQACVAIQADQSAAETSFLLELAAANDFIVGVVGWVDLKADDLEQQLESYSGLEKLKGFRSIMQDLDPDALLDPVFLEGLSALHNFDFTYDLLVKPNQLTAVKKMLSIRETDQKFVIDHLAKPLISSQKREPWAKEIAEVAAHQNVYCKLSGMVTEANWHRWKADDFSFYIEHLLEVFGPERLMFGSDWPVSLLAAEYHEVIHLLTTYTEQLTKEEQTQIWHKNAEKFYNLFLAGS